MIQAILNFFGLGKKDEAETKQPLTEGSTRAQVKTQSATSTRPAPPARPPMKKTSIRARNYYKRRGNYYSSSDDSLIEDLMLLVVLDELFSDGDIREREDETAVEEAAPVEDLLDVDVSDTPVATLDTVETGNSGNYTAPETPVPVSTPEPEPVRESVSSGSGSSYSSGSSDYDSGGSDDSGSDD